MGFLRRFNDLGIRPKLVTIVALMLLGVGIGFMSLFRSEVRTAAQEDTIAQARRVVDMAESVRHGMEEKWKLGVFDQKVVSEWAKEKKVERILGAVPIVAAWEAVMLRAKEGGYRFKTPRRGARNPENEPDEVEMRALDQLALGKAEYFELDSHKNEIRYFRPIRLSQECIMCHGSPKLSEELWGNNEGLDPTGHRMENLASGDLHGAFEIIQSLDHADQRAFEATLKGFALVGLASLAACVVLVFILNRSVINPIQEVTRAFSKLLQGDLRQDIAVTSKDEIGKLQIGINTIAKQTKGLIGNMRRSSKELESVSNELGTTAERMQNAATETTSRSRTVSAASEQMSQALESMRSSLRDVSSTVQAVANAAGEIIESTDRVTSSTQESANVAQHARQLAGNGTKQIRELEQAANGIGEIIGVIRDIADQTNLLALNATIEASRAGEAGKGFAVVATEVKQLANQTASATNEIRRRIESIQTISSVVVEAMTEIETVIDSINSGMNMTSDAVEHQRSTIHLVTHQLAEAAERTSSVANSVEETVVAAREVSKSIHDVNLIAEETSREVESTKVAGAGLRRVTDMFDSQLSEMASAFQT